MIVLQRADGQYVTPPGRALRYTKKLQEAHKFPTREAAEAERCGNERIVEFHGPCTCY